MASARPSTIAVLPTPGSPISTGLFLVRRVRIWVTRRISSERPITGSSLPSRAHFVRSRPYSSRKGVGTGLAALPPSPLSSARMRQRIVSTSLVRSCRMRNATPSPSRIMPSRMCWVEVVCEPRARASAPESSITRRARGVMLGASLRRLPSPRPMMSSTLRRSESRVAPNSPRICAALPPSRIRPSSRCSGPTIAWPRRLPSSRA